MGVCSTHRDDGVEGALAVHLVLDVVVGADQRHAGVLHAVHVVFIGHHEHQADPETHTTKEKVAAVEMQSVRRSSSVFISSQEAACREVSEVCYYSSIIMDFNCSDRLLLPGSFLFYIFGESIKI